MKRIVKWAVLGVSLIVVVALVIIYFNLSRIIERTIEVQATDGLIFTVPLVIYGVTRYLWVLYRRGGGADPSTELLKDPHLLVALAGWVALTGWLIA